MGTTREARKRKTGIDGVREDKQGSSAQRLPRSLGLEHFIEGWEITKLVTM